MRAGIYFAVFHDEPCRGGGQDEAIEREREMEQGRDWKEYKRIEVTGGLEERRGLDGIGVGFA